MSSETEWILGRRSILVALTLWLAACGTGEQAEPETTSGSTREGATVQVAAPSSTTQSTAGESTTGATSPPGTEPTTQASVPPAERTTPPATEPPTPTTTQPPAPTTTQPPTPTTATAPGITALGMPIPALGGGTTTYAVPTRDPGSASWRDTHASYPATDIFVPGDAGCGGDVTSPVTGVLIEVRRDNRYDPATDDPALRGGRSVTIVGDDGVRYYLAHFGEIAPDLTVGGRVETGQLLGVVGDSGRTSACHIHVGISPPCPDREWSVRRGAIWPYPYLDAWRQGEQRSPVEEIRQWATANPDACAAAAADPNAAEA